jgi:CARDB protein
LDFLDEDDERPKQPQDPSASPPDDEPASPPDETSILPPDETALPPDFAPDDAFADDEPFGPGDEPFAQDDDSFGTEGEPFSPREDSFDSGDEPPFLEGEGAERGPEEAMGRPPVPERRRREPRRQPRQQIVVRRLIAVGVGILLLLLFGLGLKACFNARNKSAMRDYVNRSVSSLISDSQQTSEQFFKTLNDPQGLTPLDYENEIKSDRGAADALVQRAEKVDAPGDMKRAQQALELTLELRRDGLQTISDAVPTALAREGRTKAIEEIAGAMRSFLASDVIYARIAKPSMEAALSKRGVDGVNTPDSQFLPKAPDWLDVVTVSTAMSKVAGSATTATPGTHGLGLVGTTIGNTALQEGTPARVPVTGTPELDIQVQNQGSVEEADVAVSVTIAGAESSTLEGKVPRLGPQETQTVKIPITPSPPNGSQVTITVEVQPVPGETFQDNNRAEYTVTFG